MQSPAISLGSPQLPQLYLLPPLGHHHKLMMTLMTSLLLLVTHHQMSLLPDHPHQQLLLSCHSIRRELLPWTPCQHCLLHQMPHAVESSHRSSLTL